MVIVFDNFARTSIEEMGIEPEPIISLRLRRLRLHLKILQLKWGDRLIWSGSYMSIGFLTTQWLKCRPDGTVILSLECLQLFIYGDLK